MAGSKWCTQCGSENDASAVFCKSCGKPMASGAAQGGQQSSNMAASNMPGQSTNLQGYGFQNQQSNDANRFQTKPKLKPQNSAGLGFSVYISIVALVIGVILFFFGQQQVDAYSGYPWYDPYESKAQLGSFLRAIGGICCLGGIIGLVRYFIMKK